MSPSRIDEIAAQYGNAIRDVAAVLGRWPAYASIVDFEERRLHQWGNGMLSSDLLGNIGAGMSQTIADVLESMDCMSARESLHATTRGMADVQQYEAARFAIRSAEAISATGAIGTRMQGWGDALRGMREMAVAPLTDLIGEVRVPSAASEFERFGLSAASAIRSPAGFDICSSKSIGASVLGEARLIAERQEHGFVLYPRPPKIYAPSIHVPKRCSVRSPASLTAEAHRLIVALEQALRRIIDEELTAHFGATWEEMIVDRRLFEKWRERWGQDPLRRQDASLIDYADFGDYEHVILTPECWDTVFKRFYCRRELVSECLLRLKPYRRATSHGRELRRRQIAIIYAQVDCLLRPIGMSIDDDLLPDWLR